nr:Toll/interleukin-1 receptor (TIR) domain-containing protein [Tanacetum cinerariifolium]
ITEWHLLQTHPFKRALALKQKGIKTFKDEERMKQGKTIDNQLIQAIKNSRFFIIVFSEKYASSSWCLDELVEIMDCQKT